MKNKLRLNIKGSNINRFIIRLKNNKIDILDIDYIREDEINIKIYKSDYEKLIKMKTIYEVTILNYYGLIKFKNNILENKYIISFIILFFIVLYVLSNMIFSVDIVTNDSKMRKTLLYELEKYGIKKYKFQKKYTEIQNIKNKILKNNRDKIEWIEIENIGTKYIIRFEPRVKNNVETKKELRNIIASKDAIIKSMNISSGEILKDINTYVKKGDVIVSGYIDLNGNVKDAISSNGIVYGEVWYNVSVTYPYKYKEIKETGKKNSVIVIKLLNNNIELFNFNKFKTKNIQEKTIVRNKLFPIKLVLQSQKEVKIINENNTEKELIEKALNVSQKKIEDVLKEGEYVSNYKILNKTKNNDSITLNIFFTVIEDITEYQKIDEYMQTEE